MRLLVQAGRFIAAFDMDRHKCLETPGSDNPRRGDGEVMPVGGLHVGRDEIALVDLPQIQ